MLEWSLDNLFGGYPNGCRTFNRPLTELLEFCRRFRQKIVEIVLNIDSHFADQLGFAFGPWTSGDDGYFTYEQTWDLPGEKRKQQYQEESLISVVHKYLDGHKFCCKR
jgi:hypothetical protein